MENNKIVINFPDRARARKFLQKVKELSYVTYATDYKCGSRSHVMVCGELTDERIEFINTLKK